MEEQSPEFRVHLNRTSFLLHKQNLQKKLDKYEEDFARTIKDISERQKLLSCSLSSESEHSAPSTSTSLDGGFTYGIGEGSYNSKTKKISKSESFERTGQCSTRAGISRKGEKNSHILPTKAWSFPSRAGTVSKRLTDTDENLNKETLNRPKRTLRRQKRVERIDVPSELISQQNTRADRISVANFVNDQKDKYQISFTTKSQQEYQDKMSTEPGRRSTQAGLNEQNDTNELQEDYLFKNKLHRYSLLRPANFLSAPKLQDHNFNNQANIKSVDDISRTTLEPRPVNARLSRSLQSLSPISEKKQVPSVPARRYTFNGDSDGNETEIPTFQRQVNTTLKKNQYLSHCHRDAWSMDTNEHNISKAYSRNDSERKTRNKEDSLNEKKQNNDSSKGFLQASNVKKDTEIAKIQCTNGQENSIHKSPRRLYSGKVNIAGNEGVGTKEKNPQRSGFLKERTQSLNCAKETERDKSENTASVYLRHKKELLDSKTDTRTINLVLNQKEANSRVLERPSIQQSDSCEKYTAENKINENAADNEYSNYKKSLLRGISGERNIAGNQKDNMGNNEYDSVFLSDSNDSSESNNGLDKRDKREVYNFNSDSKKLEDFNLGDRKRIITKQSYQMKGKVEEVEVEETTSSADQQLANQREGQQHIISIDDNKAHKSGVGNSQTEIANQHDGNESEDLNEVVITLKENYNLSSTSANQQQDQHEATNQHELENPEVNLPRAKGWRKLQAIPLAKIQQLQTTRKDKENTLKDFGDKNSNAGPGLLSFRQVVLAAIKKKQDEKAEAERRKQRLIKERMTAIQQPTESFLRQTLDKAVHRGHAPRPPSDTPQRGLQFRTVVKSLQSFRDLGEAVSSNRTKRAERIRKRSSVSLTYTRKLELLAQENRTVGEMMKDVEGCRYLRNKKS